MATAGTVPISEIEVLRDPARSAALLDGEKRGLLVALAEAPDSAAGLSRRLGGSRQRLNYHLRALEEAGLVELAEQRRRGNCVERVLRPVARRFVLDPAALGALAPDPDRLADRFSATYLIALAARTIRELAGLRENADERGLRLATAALETELRLARPADFEAFVRDLSEAVAGVVAHHHREDAEGRTFRLILSAHPAPAGRSEPEADDATTGGRT